MIKDRKVSIQFSVNWVLVILLVAALLIAGYMFGPVQYRPTMVYLVAVFASAAGLTNALNALEQRGATAQAARVAASMAMIHLWNAPNFYECKRNGRMVTQFFKDHSSIDAQLQYLEGNEDHRAHLIDILNVFEALAIGINRNVLDEDTVKDFFRSMVINYWHLTETWIKNRRAERSNARLNKDFEWLYNRWKD